MKLRLIVLILSLIQANAALAQTPTSVTSSSLGLHGIDPQSPQDLQELFRPTDLPLPIVSAHRGGSRQGFPENCIATFEDTLQHAFAILEIDPRYTQDGEIVVLHDSTLERTTTGDGLVGSCPFSHSDSMTTSGRRVSRNCGPSLS